jgi:hypothetical protein
MICLPILFFSPHTLFYIDYNTIGPVYLFLSTLLVLCNTDESKRKARGFISGVLAARGIIGTPYIIASLLLLILILLVKRNWIQILYFSLGVFLFSSVAVIYFSSHRGLKNLINGILYIIYQQGYTDKLSQLNRHFVGIQVIEFLIPFFVIMIIGALIYMLFHESNYKIYCILIKMCAFISASIAIVFGLLSFPVSVYRNDFENYIKYSWFISLFIMTFNKNSRRGQHRFNLFYPILAITQYMFTCFYNITGAIEREYILYFCTVISFWMLIKYCSIPDACYFYKLKVEIVSAIMCIVLSKIVYTYVYINTNIQQLNSYIASGVYKGCYSDTSTASFIITVEERIKKYTSKGETVAFVDNIPYAYLMSNSYPFTATTLGETKRNGLEYYHLEKRNPDKIIYLNGSLTKDEYDKFVRNNYFLEYYDNWASNTMEVYQIKK